jgi:hypothetical protein
MRNGSSFPPARRVLDGPKRIAECPVHTEEIVRPSAPRAATPNTSTITKVPKKRSSFFRHNDSTELAN